MNSVSVDVVFMVIAQQLETLDFKREMAIFMVIVPPLDFKRNHDRLNLISRTQVEFYVSPVALSI